jgi:hypothetical protein
LPSQLPPQFSGAQVTDGGFHIDVSQRDEIPGLIDALHGAGVKIYEVHQYHASLEEAFLRTMGDADAHGIGGTQ